MATDENTTDTKKGAQPEVQDKKDDPRVTTVTPDNDNGDPGPPPEQESYDKSGDQKR